MARGKVGATAGEGGQRGRCMGTPVLMSTKMKLKQFVIITLRELKFSGTSELAVIHCRPPELCTGKQAPWNQVWGLPG